MTEGLDCDNWGIQSAQLKTREPKSHDYNNWEAENAIKYFFAQKLIIYSHFFGFKNHILFFYLRYYLFSSFYSNLAISKFFIDYIICRYNAMGPGDVNVGASSFNMHGFASGWML